MVTEDKPVTKEIPSYPKGNFRLNNNQSLTKILGHFLIMCAIRSEHLH